MGMVNIPTGLVISLLLMSLCQLCEGRIHHVDIKHDERPIVTFERFTYVPGGVLNFTISNFNMELVDKSKDEESSDPVYGFLVTKDESVEDFETSLEQGSCLFKPDQAIWSKNYGSSKEFWQQLTVGWTVTAETEGTYHLYFASCLQNPSRVSFVFDAALYNPGPDYLSAGESAVPTVLFAFSVLFLLLCVVWVSHLRKNRGMVNDVHNVMTVLLVVKVLSLFTAAIDKHFVKILGTTNWWNLPYYVFTFLKGVATFTVILLVGAGWSVLKPTLNARERRVLMVVIFLQLFANIAMVVEEELSPGSYGWVQWRDLLHVLDFVCSIAIFLPIMWQIKHLRSSARADGKMERNLHALTQFRKFYVSVIAYIYFTRVLVYLLGEMLPAKLFWVQDFSRESATFIFYTLTGYNFRPGSENPYARVRTAEVELYEDSEGELDEELNEFGLPDVGESEQDRV